MSAIEPGTWTVIWRDGLNVQHLIDTDDEGFARALAIGIEEGDGRDVFVSGPQFIQVDSAVLADARERNWAAIVSRLRDENLALKERLIEARKRPGPEVGL